jgi:glycosyltransferase involved in cell wall biosynthesis
MHILIVSRGVVPIGRRAGGAEHVCYELAKRLADQGDDVVLVSDVDSGAREDAPERLRIAEVGMAQRSGPVGFGRWIAQHFVGNVRAARRACEVIGEPGDQFDVVHSHGALVTVLVARRLRETVASVPLLYTEHDATPWTCRYRGRFERLVRRGIYRGVNLRACRAATSVVTNFSTLGDELATRSHLERTKFTTVANGVDGAVANGGTTETDPVDDGPFLLFVGSLVDRKAPDLLVRAMAQVGLRCVFAGDGPMREHLEALAEQLGVDGRVQFRGALEPAEVAELYASATALVLPSVSEGLPLVAVEALRAGVPVVASRLDGIATVVQDRVNGLLVEPGDAASLASALVELEHDAELLATLRRGATESAPSVLEWSEVASQLRTLYGQLSELAGPPLQPVGASASPVAPLELPRRLGAPWETLPAQQWRRAA